MASEQTSFPFNVREAARAIGDSLNFPASLPRSTDRQTSAEAANANTYARSLNRWMVLEALYEQGTNGATDYELSIACGLLRTSAGKRRLELMDVENVRKGRIPAPLVEQAKFTRKTDTGSSAMVWRLTQAGRDFYEEQLKEKTCLKQA